MPIQELFTKHQALEVTLIWQEKYLLELLCFNMLMKGKKSQVELWM